MNFYALGAQACALCSFGFDYLTYFCRRFLMIMNNKIYDYV